MRADASANRQRILAAAGELFATRGLDVPLDEIARGAGVGPGTLHRHYPSKHGLIAAVAREHLEELIAAAHHRSGAADPVAALHDQLTQMITAGDRSAPLKQALAGSPEDVAWSQTDESRRLREALGQLLAAAQNAGGVRPDLDADDLMAVLTGCYSAIQRGGGTADSARGRRLTGLLLAGLALSPAPS